MSTRSYCFTHNNYDDEVIKQWQELECKFIQFGKEIAPTTGTPHLQGFVYLTSPKTLSAAIKAFPKGAHIERCKGNVSQNMAYTGKDGNVFKKGDPPYTQEDKGKRGEVWYKDQREAMRAGNLDDVSEFYKTEKPELIKKHRRAFLQEQKLEDVTTPHFWFVGGPGTGKSRTAREMDSEFYDKDFSKWWDGYDGQKTVLLDDIDVSHAFMLHNLKRWADRYPFPAEQKGYGKLQIRPETIIVTSNYEIQDIWPNRVDYEPLLRRFTIRRF